MEECGEVKNIFKVDIINCEYLPSRRTFLTTLCGDFEGTDTPIRFEINEGTLISFCERLIKKHSNTELDKFEKKYYNLMESHEELLHAFTKLAVDIVERRYK